MEKKRSIGVTIFSLYLVIVGVLSSFFSIQVIIRLIHSGAISRMIDSGTISAQNGTLFIRTIVFIAFIVGGVFVYLRKNWARRMMVIICSIYGTLSVSVYIYYNLLTELPIWFFSLMIFMTYIFPIVFLTRPKVKEQFK